MQRCDILVECERLERAGLACEHTALVRLHHMAQRGELLSADNHTMIRTLMEKLQIAPTKKISVATKNHQRDTVTWDYAFLTQPLGAYYTKLTTPHKIVGYEEVQATWRNNPIELVEVFDIVSADNLRHQPMQETRTVSLHFAEPNLAIGMRVLVSLKLETCVTLELRNLKIDRDMVPALKNRMAWPKLQNIILKG